MKYGCFLLGDAISLQKQLGSTEKNPCRDHIESQKQ